MDLYALIKWMENMSISNLAREARELIVPIVNQTIEIILGHLSHGVPSSNLTPQGMFNPSIGLLIERLKTIRIASPE